MQRTRFRRQGRVSWWLIAGIGCLGIVALCLIGSFLVGRQIQSNFGESIRQASEMEQTIRPRLAAVYDAIQQYVQDNNGQYPQDLKALVPKYVPEETIAPIKMSDGTEVKLVYRRPAPDAGERTVILEHDPPIKIVVTLFGETAETLQTLQVRKNGRITTKQETLTSQDRGKIPPPNTSPPTGTN
ncbi:MAG: hypothetical protein SNJ72_03885 [Fimbriimonadales bacterium]